MEHLMYPLTSIQTNITGRANPLAGGPDLKLRTTMSGDSLFSTLSISPIERDGSFLTSKYLGSISQSKVRHLHLKPLLRSSIIGQATTNGAGSPWSHPLASCSTGNSQCIGYYISWDSYQREFRRKDADWLSTWLVLKKNSISYLCTYCPLFPPLNTPSNGVPGLYDLDMENSHFYFQKPTSRLYFSGQQ